MADKKDDAAANAPGVDPQFSTLEVVADHLDAKKFASAQQSNGLYPVPGHSTLESYNNPDKADTSEKIALEPTILEEKEAKEKDWKRKRVFGVPLLFLVIGGVLVVVVAAVVGGVVGSRSGSKKGDENAAANVTALPSPTTTNTNAPAAVGTQPSDPYFTSSVLYSIITDAEDGTQLRFEGPAAHNRAPSDAVFIGEAVPNDNSQRWDVALLPGNLATKYTAESGHGAPLFYLRLEGTNLAAQIDDLIWDSINHGSKPNGSRKDVPLVLREFNAEEKNQMWYFNKPGLEAGKDRMYNHGLFNPA